MWEYKHPLAEALDELTRSVAVGDRRQAGNGAAVRGASLSHPDRLAVAINLYSARCSPRSSFGHLRPVLYSAIRIGEFVDGFDLVLCVYLYYGEYNQHDDGYYKCEFHST